MPQLASKRKDVALLKQGLRVVQMLVERVGFVEKKSSSKELNQYKREVAVKDAFAKVEGCAHSPCTVPCVPAVAGEWQDVLPPRRFHAVLSAFKALDAKSSTSACDVFCRLLISIAFSHQDTTPFAVVQLVLDSVRSHLPVVWEWSRSKDPRLRVSACGLVRGLILESAEAVAKDVQLDALQSGVSARAGGLAFAPPALHLVLRVPVLLRVSGVFVAFALCNHAGHVP